MKELPTTPNSGTVRRKFAFRLQRWRLARQGMFGLSEVIALAGSAVVLIVVVIAYLYFLVPARSNLASLQLERERLQTQLRNSQNVVKEGETTEATVHNITQSLDDFESSWLASASEGRMSLYDSLNDQIRKNALRNTSGPTYVPLEPAGTKSSPGSTKAASTKWQSAYPGIAISLTVEGAYPNLRKFVRDIETSRQFIIINSVELERATEGSSSVALEGAPMPQRSLVSLRLDMATYFKRNLPADSGQQEVH